VVLIVSKKTDKNYLSICFYRYFLFVREMSIPLGEFFTWSALGQKIKALFKLTMGVAESEYAGKAFGSSLAMGEI
jgi:hypothetical protein